MFPRERRRMKNARYEEEARVEEGRERREHTFMLTGRRPFRGFHCHNVSLESWITPFQKKEKDLIKFAVNLWGREKIYCLVANFFWTPAEALWIMMSRSSKKFPRAGFEPATYGYLTGTTTVHRSTNWAIEGDTSKEGPVLYKFTWLDKGNSTALLTFRPVTKLSTTSWEGVTQVIRGANRSHTDITGA